MVKSRDIEQQVPQYIHAAFIAECSRWESGKYAVP